MNANRSNRTKDEPQVGRSGAYGLILAPQQGDAAWWADAPSGWETWNMVWDPTSGRIDREEWLDAESAGISLAPSGFAFIERSTSTTRLMLDFEPAPLFVVHPYVVSTAIAAATWSGREAFHSAGFVLDGRVWGILGDRGMGKSTTVAWLKLRGLPIFCDDLLVLREETALAGPRSLDLREEAAARFGLGADIGVVGTRRRWRVHLDSVAAEMPFGGWVVLRWSPGRPSVEPVKAVERFEHLLDSRALLLEPKNPTSWLALVAKPMVVFSRPREWDSLDAGMEMLLAALTTFV